MKMKGGKGLSFSFIVWCLLVSWVGGTALAAAQTPSFTLNQAIETALLHHPVVREAELNLWAAQLKLEAARASALLPQLGLLFQPLSLSSQGIFPGRAKATLSAGFTLPTGTGLSFNLSPSLDYATSTWTFSYGLDLSQRFGVTQSDGESEALQEKERALSQAEAALERAKDEVVLKVIEQFGKLLSGQVAVASAEETLAQRQTQSIEIEAKVGTGQAGDLQRLEAELALKKAEIAFRKRKAEDTTAQAKFKIQLGIEGPYEVLPPQLSGEKIKTMAKALLAMEIPPQVIHEAEVVTKARVAVEAAERELQDARVAALPAVSLAASWTSEGWQVGVTMKFDLFSPRHSFQVKLAQVALELAQERLKVAQQEARMAILNQRTDLRQAVEEFERLQLEKEKWALEETIMQKKLEAEVISTDEWTAFHMKKGAFESDQKQGAFDLVLVSLRYRQVLGLKLNWEEILS